MCDTEYTLALHGGLTFAGIKAASLFWVRGEQLPAVRQYGERFSCRGFRFVVLRCEEKRCLLYVYHEARLREILFEAANRTFLRSCGYVYGDVVEAVMLLGRRIADRNAFPHEIGLFLGYPLEDVRGFIGESMHTAYFSGYWKVYAEPEKKSRLFAQYRRCSERICGKVKQGAYLGEIFKI